MAAGQLSLAEALRRVGWNPRQLGTAVNVWLMAHGKPDLRIDPTAPYAWVNKGFCPRTPIPSVVATVMSEELGRPVSAADLWPGRIDEPVPSLSAADDLDGYRSVDEAMGALGDLADAGRSGQQHVLGATGADLTAAVLDGLRLTVRWTRHRAGHERVLPPQVEVIAAHVVALRRLDDRHGGGSLSLRYVSSELRNVLDLVRWADYEPKVGRRLLAIVADLAQLVGWLHFDSGAYGAAERYLLLSVQIANSLGERGRAANAVGMLAYVSAFAGHGIEALRVADAAAGLCSPGDRLLEARIAGRVATAAAAAGDLSRFRESTETARDLMTYGCVGDVPTFLYYLEPVQLIAEAGQGLVVLAGRVTVYRKQLLREAIELLAPISAIGQRPNYPRSALLHSTFLAEAYLALGDLDHAIDAVRAATTRLDEVQSPRGRTRLRQLRPALGRRKRNPAIAEFLPELDRALSQA
jgi:tetratricopeptide (TPR) repeat protein